MSFLWLVGMQRLILASASPARAKLLREAGIEFDVKPMDIDEDTDKQAIKDPETLVKTLAEKKGKAASVLHPNAVILTADTIVYLDGEVIGKPKDRADAKRIIQQLAGATHEVWTGVCLLKQTSEVIFSDVSKVTFRPMTNTEIEAYLDTEEWVGKAGAYQIQKTMGRYVEKLVGSEANVIGLPVERVLKNLNYED